MKKYYQLTNIMKADCTYNILLGQKGNGKSYAVKDYLLQIAYREKDPFTWEPLPCYQFAYFRRWDLENTAGNIEQYFSDFVMNDDGRCRISEITDGEYTTIACWQKKIYFANVDPDTGKIIRGKLIGYSFSVARTTKYSSLAYPQIGQGVYEEFITTEGYQPQEPSKLMILISTIFRGRDAKIFLVGNTMSRECPYFSEWQLVNVPRMKQNQIDVYRYHTEDGAVIPIAVENCDQLGAENKLIIGRRTKMITSGQWDSEEQPHLPEPLEHYTLKHVYFVKTDNLVYMCRLLKKGKDLLIYVCPHTKDIKDPDHTRIFQKGFSLNILHNSRLLTDKLKYDLIISEIYQLGKICYSDNLTGTDFSALLKREGNFR